MPNEVRKVSDPREASIKVANRTTDELGVLFTRMGNATHPRGNILSPYRVARRALSDLFRRQGTGPSSYREAAFILANLRSSLYNVAGTILADAATLGEKSALTQVLLWTPPNSDLGHPGLPGVTALLAPGTRQPGSGTPQLMPGARAPIDLSPSLTAWMARVDVQIAQTLATLSTGGDVSEILGDESRVGLLRESDMVNDGTRWITDLTSAAFIALILWLLNRGSGIPVFGTGEPTQPVASPWYHQVVAAIDERTTDCCLRAHGQTMPLDAAFRLTGFPRYADSLAHPPFHWYCRTSEVILPAHLAKDSLTMNMRDAARRELAARPSRQEIHPAHATSGRGTRVPS